MCATPKSSVVITTTTVISDTSTISASDEIIATDDAKYTQAAIATPSTVSQEKAWALAAVPVAGNVGSSVLEVARCEQQYKEAVQNLRGLIGRLRSQQARQRVFNDAMLDPTKAQYQILGMEGELSYVERPLQVKGREQDLLTHICVQVVERLAAYVHSKLLAWGMQEQDRKEQELVDSKVEYAVASDIKLASAMPNMRVRHLVVGLSGGPDSTLALILAVALQQSYGYRVLAVHCIHGLDPDDAIWLKHNQDLCSSLGVMLKTPRLNIVYGMGRSPEEVSRAERYLALLHELQADSCLVLGHQADDQVENLLLSLKRGAGPQGLGGMRLLTKDERGLLLRPLLALHKSEIEQILTQLGFAFVYDLSNGYIKFERNFVRLKILPLLRERFAGIDKALLRSQQLCAYEHDLAERLVAEKLGGYLTTNIYGAQGYSFDFANIDVGDRPLLIMLLRAWVQHILGFSAELNLLERCYELILKPHDRNGEVLFTPSPYVASSFLHYLCLYKPLKTETQQALERLSKADAAPISLALDLRAAKAQYYKQEPKSEPIPISDQAQLFPKPLTGRVVSTACIGELNYYLISLDSDMKVLRDSAFTALAPFKADVNVDSHAVFAERESIGLSSLQVHTASGTFSIRAHSYFAVSAKIKTLYLYFAYAQSLKLKPQWRVHSRECKKLMLEYKVAPWIRAALPLVCTASGQVLACANLWVQDPKVEVKVPIIVSNSVQDNVQASDTYASDLIYLALAITRESM